MIKYAICTDRFEFKFPKGRSIPDMTGQEIFDTYFSGDTRITSNSFDPDYVAVFDTKEAAMAEWERNYKDFGLTYQQDGNVMQFLVGDIAYLEEQIFDDDGFITSGDIWEYSAMPYTKED